MYKPSINHQTLVQKIRFALQILQPCRTSTPKAHQVSYLWNSDAWILEGWNPLDLTHFFGRYRVRSSGNVVIHRRIFTDSYGIFRLIFMDVDGFRLFVYCPGAQNSSAKPPMPSPKGWDKFLKSIGCVKKWVWTIFSRKLQRFGWFPFSPKSAMKTKKWRSGSPLTHMRSHFGRTTEFRSILLARFTSRCCFFFP